MHVLKIPQAAVGLAIVMNARTAGLYGLTENLPDALHQPAAVFLTQVSCRPHRVDSRIEKRLRSIDVADSVDNRLIQQRRLYRYLLILQFII